MVTKPNLGPMVITLEQWRNDDKLTAALGSCRKIIYIQIKNKNCTFILYIYRCYFSKSAFTIKMKINLKLSFKKMYNTVTIAD